MLHENIVSCYHHLCLPVLNTHEIQYVSYYLLGDLLGGLAGESLRVMPQSLQMLLRCPAFVATAPALSPFVCLGQSVLPLLPVYQRWLSPLAAPHTRPIHLGSNPFLLYIADGQPLQLLLPPSKHLFLSSFRLRVCLRLALYHLDIILDSSIIFPFISTSTHPSFVSLILQVQEETLGQT